MTQQLSAIFNSDFFVIFWWISSVIVIISVFYVWYLVFRWIMPVLYRLWIALSKREIAVFATTEYTSLKNMLDSSWIFREDNIYQILPNSLSDADEKTIFLVHWKDFKDKIDIILAKKRSNTALIIYAPQNEGFIEPREMVEKINSYPNTTIVNFRGRLLNDILVSMITTSYFKK